ncbi:MAG: hypoxanthine/guanine phosphoribosyltransferase [Halobacteriaceae archaeon]
MERLLASMAEAPIVDRDGYDYLVHPISNCVPMLDPALLREVVVKVVRTADLDVDKIVTPEAMGIHISTAVSLFADLPLVVVRKRSYGLPGEVGIQQQTGYAESEMYLNDVDPDDRVLVLDDLLSTGNTLQAITAALEEVGATIADVIVVIRKVDSESAMADTAVPVTSLVDIRIDDGSVTVVNP